MTNSANNNTCALSPASSSRIVLPPTLRPPTRSKSGMGPKRGGARRATGAPGSESRKTPPKASGSAPGAELAHQPGVNKSMNKRWRKRRRLFARARKERNHKGRRWLLVIPHAHRALSTPAAHTSTRKSTIIAKGSVESTHKVPSYRPATSPLPHQTGQTGAVTAVASLDGLAWTCVLYS